MVSLTLDHWVAADWRVYTRKKPFIESALKGKTGILNGVTEKNKRDVFYMLLFCLCVPQSKALKAEEAVDIFRTKKLYESTLSLSEVIAILLRRVRFHTVKAKRLLEARQIFLETDFWGELKKRYSLYIEAEGHWREVALASARRFLMNRVNGMAMKLSSHFMRNVGMSGLAILDVHVIDGLKKRGVIDIEKLGASRSEYEDIEEKMKEYAQQVGISLDALDLLLWSQKTGYVFK